MGSAANSSPLTVYGLLFTSIPIRQVQLRIYDYYRYY